MARCPIGLVSLFMGGVHPTLCARRDDKGEMIFMESGVESLFVGGISSSAIEGQPQNQSSGYSAGCRVYSSEGTSTTLRASIGGLSGGTGILISEDEVDILAYSKSGRGEGKVEHRITEQGIANTLTTGDGCSNQSTQNFIKVTDEMVQKLKIRKITPLECERLMGFEDDWTKFGTDSDWKVYALSKSARYKACGNGIVPVVPKTILGKLIPQGEVCRIFSTFSGVDGSSQALDSKQFPKVGFCEFDPKASIKGQHAANVLRFKYPSVPNFGDITKVKVEDIPDHDLIFVSAPCQSFSISGKRAGFEDTRGTLFYETARIMVHKKPKYFIFENVVGLLSHDKGNTFRVMLEVYSSLGYELDFEICNAKHYGIPQNRARVFMFGRLK